MLNNMILDAARQKKNTIDPLSPVKNATTMDGLETAFLAAVKGPEAGLSHTLKNHTEVVKKAAADFDSVKPDEVFQAINALKIIRDSVSVSDFSRLLEETAYGSLHDFNKDIHTCHYELEKRSENIGREKVKQIKSVSKQFLTGILYDDQGGDIQPESGSRKEVDSQIAQIEKKLNQMEAERDQYQKALPDMREDYMNQLGLEEISRKVDDAMAGKINVDFSELYSQVELIEKKAQEAYPFWSGTEQAKEYETLAKKRIELLQVKGVPFKAFSQQVIDKLIESSPITPEAARAWAEQQEVTTGAWNRLKKQRYNKEAFLNDLAEYYRLTHGRLPAVTVETKRQQRANASPDAGTIRLGSHFDKRVLFHELSHLLEGDKNVRWASYEHMAERTQGEKAQWLGKLTGNHRYNRNERAKPDKFFSPYMGKDYPQKITEILSMGIQEFSSPERAGKLFKEDRETFEYTIGLLSGMTDKEHEVTVISEIARNAKKSEAERYSQFLKDMRKAMKKVAWVPLGYGSHGYKEYALNGNANYTYSKYGRGVIIENTAYSWTEEQAKMERFLTALAVQQKVEFKTVSRQEVVEDKKTPSWYQPGMEIPLPDAGWNNTLEEVNRFSAFVDAVIDSGYIKLDVNYWQPQPENGWPVSGFSDLRFFDVKRAESRDQKDYIVFDEAEGDVDGRKYREESKAKALLYLRMLDHSAIETGDLIPQYHMIRHNQAPEWYEEGQSLPKPQPQS